MSNDFCLSFLTPAHIGIILTVIGTVLLAFSVQVITPDDDGWGFTTKSGKAVVATYTSIVLWRFYFGLILVSVGSLMQW